MVPHVLTGTLIAFWTLSTVLLWSTVQRRFGGIQLIQSGRSFTHGICHAILYACCHLLHEHCELQGRLCSLRDKVHKLSAKWWVLLRFMKVKLGTIKLCNALVLYWPRKQVGGGREWNWGSSQNVPVACGHSLLHWMVPAWRHYHLQHCPANVSRILIFSAASKRTLSADFLPNLGNHAVSQFPSLHPPVLCPNCTSFRPADDTFHVRNDRSWWEAPEAVGGPNILYHRRLYKDRKWSKPLPVLTATHEWVRRRVCTTSRGNAWSTDCWILRLLRNLPKQVISVSGRGINGALESK